MEIKCIKFCKNSVLLISAGHINIDRYRGNHHDLDDARGVIRRLCIRAQGELSFTYSFWGCNECIRKLKVATSVLRLGHCSSALYSLTFLRIYVKRKGPIDARRQELVAPAHPAPRHYI